MALHDVLLLEQVQLIECLRYSQNFTSVEDTFS